MWNVGGFDRTQYEEEKKKREACPHYQQRPWGHNLHKCVGCGMLNNRAFFAKVRQERASDEPRKRRIVLSDAPCTTNCWNAHPDTDCECSCAGENHGQFYIGRVEADNVLLP